eukprot:RCo039778
MGTFPSLPSALRWRSSPTPTDAAEPRSAGESSTAAATGPTSTRRGRAADPTAPSPAMFYPQLQAKLVAMEKQGLYPGWKYREEALTRELMQYRLMLHLTLTMGGCYLGVRALRILSQKLLHRDWFQRTFFWATIPFSFAGCALLRNELHEFFPSLSRAQNSLVCEEICPVLLKHRQAYDRMLPPSAFEACERYCRTHRLPVPAARPST